MKVSFFLSDDWHKNGNLHVVGKLYYMESFLSEGENAKLFDSNPSNEALFEVAERLNGFFSLILNISLDKNVLIADRMGSYPLYYSVNEKEESVSVYDGHGLANFRFEAFHFDSLKEFLSTGYNTGSRTIARGLRRVEPGTIVIIENTDKGMQIRKHEYWGYIPNEQGSQYVDEHDMLLAQDEMICTIIDRLIQYANGRQICLALSGGYDSRIIALQLRRVGYDNVCLYSFGGEANKDAEVASFFAEKLRLPWHFVKYTNAKWASLRDDEEYLSFARLSGGFGNCPGAQQFIALRELIQAGRISPNAVITDGQSADVQTGAKADEVDSLYRADAPELNADEVVQGVIVNNYNFWANFAHELLEFWTPFVQESLGDLSRFSSGASAYEYWQMKERQAKRVMKGGVDQYNHFGLNWWLPYFDNDFFKYWMDIPIAYKKGRRLYKAYLCHLYSNILKLGSEKEALSRNDSSIVDTLQQRLIISAVKSRFASTLRPLWRRYRLISEYKNHPHQFGGFFPEEYYIQMRKISRGFEPLLALDYVNVLRGEKVRFDSKKNKAFIYDVFSN